MDRKRRKIEKDLPSKSPNQLATKDSSTSLQDLPDELIQKIFGYCSQNNDLPLVNSYFNQLLKFDPQYKGDGAWRNISLAMEVIKTNYLVSLNQRLDFTEIQKSIDSFKHSMKNCDEKYHFSPCLRRMQDKLATFECSILKFRKQKYGLSSCFLNHKTMSVRILAEIENRVPGVVIQSPEILQLEVDVRWSYCQLSRKLMSYDDTGLLQSAEKHRRLPAPSIWEDFLEIEAIMLFGWKELGIDGSPIKHCNSGLKYRYSIANGIKYIPAHLYRGGITLDTQWELIIRLEKSRFYIQEEDAKILVLQTLDNLQPANYHKVKFQKVTIKEILLYLLVRIRSIRETIIHELEKLMSAYDIQQDLKVNKARRAIHEEIRDSLVAVRLKKTLGLSTVRKYASHLVF